MQRPSRTLLTVVFVLLWLIWGTTWAAIRLGLEGIPPFTGVALRFGIAALVLLIAVRVAGVRLGRSRREVALWLLNGGLGFSVSYGVVYWAEQWVPSGLTAVLFATFTLFVAVLSHVLLGERLTPGSIAGIVLGLVGLAVIYSEDFSLLGGPQIALAALVLMLSPIAAAVASVAIKRWGRGIHPFSLTAVPMAVTAVLMGGIAWRLERELTVTFDAQSISALLYLAIIGSALSFSLYYWLLSHMTATEVSLIAYLTPLLALFIGTTFLDEPLTARTVAGSALVLVGVALVVRSGSRARQLRTRSIEG